MTDNVLEFTGDWYGEMSPGDLLEKAKSWGSARILVIGYTEDGEVTGGSSVPEVGEIILLLERFKLKLLSGGFAIS